MSDIVRQKKRWFLKAELYSLRLHGSEEGRLRLGRQSLKCYAEKRTFLKGIYYE